MDERAMRDAITRELGRIGIRPETLPNLSMSAGAAARFLSRLERLPVRASWRAVLPDVPAHWIPDRPESWTKPYRPIGPYDYQALPTGPAIHVQWPTHTDHACLARLMDDAREHGWPLHGAGFLPVTNPEWPTLDAMLVLDRGTSEDTLDEMMRWIDARSDVTLAGIPRRGDETYHDDTRE